MSCNVLCVCSCNGFPLRFAFCSFSHTISAGRFFRCDVPDARVTRVRMRPLMTLDETWLRIRNDAILSEIRRRRSRPCCQRTLRRCYYQYYSTKLKFRYSILISARWTSIFKFNLIYPLKRHLSRHHFKFLNFRWNVCEEPFMCMFVVIVIIVWTLMNIFVTSATSWHFNDYCLTSPTGNRVDRRW